MGEEFKNLDIQKKEFERNRAMSAPNPNIISVVENMINNIPKYEGPPIKFWFNNIESQNNYIKIMKPKNMVKRLKNRKRINSL